MGSVDRSGRCVIAVAASDADAARLGSGEMRGGDDGWERFKSGPLNMSTADADIASDRNEWTRGPAGAVGVPGCGELELAETELAVCEARSAGSGRMGWIGSVAVNTWAWQSGQATHGSTANTGSDNRKKAHDEITEPA